MLPPRSLPHDDLGNGLVAITVLLLTLSAAFLFTRLYLKVHQRRRLWWDDYILVVAWVCIACRLPPTRADGVY